jgi:hypothetical protein
LKTIIEAAVPKGIAVPKGNVPDGVSTKATDSYGVPWGTAVPKGVSMATAVLRVCPRKPLILTVYLGGAAVPKGVSMATAVSEGVTTNSTDSNLGGLLYLKLYPWRLLY